MIEIKDIFDVILDAINRMRYTGNVTNTALISANNYTFETDFVENLEVGKFIEFDNGSQGEIMNITGTTITIRTYNSNIVIDGNFKRLDPFSGQNLRIQIAKNFAMKSTDPIVLNKQKFPAIEIIRDEIASEEDVYSREYFDSIQLMFVNASNHEWSGTERNDSNFKDILMPLFNRFKESLYNSSYLRFKHEIKYKKKRIDRDNYFGKNKNAINHFVDVLRIDINNLVLDTNIDCNINL